MKCKDQEDLLGILRDKQYAIASMYLMKFGTIAISTTDPDDDSLFEFTDRSRVDTEFENDGLAVCKEIASAVESHPNVFDFEVLNEDFPPSEYLTLGYKLFHGPIYKASVHLPKMQQKYQDMECEEHFSVFLSGTYFAAVTEINHLSGYSNMAHEFREIFRSQVQAKTKFHAPLIGPCPMHQDLFLIGVRVPSGVQSLDIPLLYTSGDDLYVVVSYEKIDDYISEMFWDCLLYLCHFYELQLSRIKLIHIDTEIQARMSILVDAHTGFASAPVWRFRSIHRHLTVAREQLANIYQLRVEHSKEVSSYKRQRKLFLDRVSQSKLVYELNGDLKPYTRLDVDLPDSLLPSLQFFQVQADAKRGAYSLLIATLIGALIGGFITLAATLLSTSKHN